MSQRLNYLFNALGPGILLAATAIGVSHLVQSVQAGAKYGLLFILFILFAHIIKYPFFEAAPRYSSVTKKTLLHGYYDLHPAYLVIYLIVTLLSVFTLLSAVTVVAAGIFANMIKLDFNIHVWSTIVLTSSYLILAIGKYEFLDRSIKYVILALTITSILSLVLALTSLDLSSRITVPEFSFSNNLDLLFLIGFLGWMPCPLDCAVWNSIWIVEKKHNDSIDVSYKKSLLDFRAGYLTTAILGIIFLLLGYVMFYGSGTELPPKSIGFVAKFLEVYTNSLGSWSFYLIATAAFITMFSTVITCTDGYHRSIAKSIKLLFYDRKNNKCDEDKIYLYVLTACVIITLLVIYFLIENMRQLVLIATVISFLTTPILAWFNLKLLTHKNYPKKYRPSKRYIAVSYVMLSILICLAVGFILSRIL